MKCENCGGTEFVAFKDFFECVMCGSKLMVENTKEPEKEEKEEEKEPSVEVIELTTEEKLYNSLKMYFEQPSLNSDEVKALAKELIKNNSQDLYARCILSFVDRDRFPENYKRALCDLAQIELDDEKIKWLVPALIENSEYKFINSISNLLLEKNLYQDYASKLKEARERLEEESENFSSAPRDIFICYSSNDTLVAEKVVEHLEADGNTCWIAKRNIPQNSFSRVEYRNSIKDAMSKCKVFLVIASKNSMLSKEVENELDYADELGIENRIEYRIEDVENTSRFKEFFDGVQWIDASEETQYYVLISQVYDMLHPRHIIKEELQENPQINEEIKEISQAKEELKEMSVVVSLPISFDKESYLREQSVSLHFSNEENEDELPPQADVFNTQANVPEEVFDKKEFTDSCCTELENLSEEKREAVALSLFKKNDYDSAFKILDQMENPSLDNLTLYYVGESFEKGLGTEVDKDTAKQYYELAKAQVPKGGASDLGICYYSLGMKHINGDFLEKDENEAISLFEKSAKYNNEKAIFNLGMIYKSKDLTKAVEYFSAVTSKMPAKAYLQLGICYAKMNNIPKAVECYRISATHKEDIAMTNLGTLYYYGRGVEPNYEKAIHWFTQGALNGNATAQFNLGNCYQKGRGTSVDLERAKSWYQKAAQNGNEEAKKRLEELQG